MERLSPRKRLFYGLAGLTTLITSFAFIYESTNQQDITVSKETLAIETAELLGMVVAGAVILESVGDIMEEHYSKNNISNLNNPAINVNQPEISD